MCRCPPIYNGNNQEPLASHPKPARTFPLPQVSLPTQYNGKNQEPVGALSSTLARLQANRQVCKGGRQWLR